ncbi:HTH-type transcriptional repressor YcgE [Marinomonas spartinae]|uniref:HTH-type transcriptional repressor YcgE n=1 Tax=Marinomonas spartinae TaxID=1792290 RepID=A0A1A8TAA3_9GAMM|nr:MerR family transcriptional regulator [Marinomonas spartinae]SBS28156.1 HTH-type transcriptional repressor YcgE [Marinomonas spartinae]SBS28402.1 HTH-type transcriptional repressor YcgE [Marinomonas spartinae]
MKNDLNKENADVFAIRTLSEKTGVNSVTLRAWERRYGLLKPKRTAKGHRLYNLNDVQRVESIVHWIQQGVSVSKVRSLLDKVDTGASLESLELSNEWLDWQDQLVMASYAFDEDKIAHLYQQVFSQYPSSIVVRNWIIPSLDKLAREAAGRFCETVLTACLCSRLMTLKDQQKAAPKVLITGLLGQRTLWCFLAAAILSDQGHSCMVMPMMASPQELNELVLEGDSQGVIVFAEGEFINNINESIAMMSLWGKPTSIIGASFWVALQETEVALAKSVYAYSEPLEGILGFALSKPR